MATQRPAEEVDPSFADRLSEVMAKGRIRQKDLAGRIGKSEGAVSRWVGEGRLPSIATVKRIAAATGASVDWLLGLPDRRPVPPTAPAKGDDWHELPKVAFAAAGEPVQNLPNDAIWYAFHRSWVTKRMGKGALNDDQRLVVVQVEKKHLGESMLPTIRPGAIVVVDRGPGGRGIADAREVKQGSIYLVNPGEGLTVKRVFVAGDILTLASDNPDQRVHYPRPLSLKGRVLQQLLIGRVVWVGHEED